MLMTFPREQHRGMCWYRLLHDRPLYEADGYVFMPSEHHFRKHHHSEAGWGWYVAKWRYQGDNICQHQICDAPPNLDIGECETYPYVWSVWTEYDGTEACGFVLGGHY